MTVSITRPDDRAKRVLSQALNLSGHEGWSLALRGCGTVVKQLQCEQCGYTHPIKYHCKLKACPSCLSRRAYQVQLRYLKVLQRLPEPKFWTLTLRSTKQLKHGVERIRKAFEKFRHRAAIKRCLRGGVYAIECNPHRDGTWNVHIHAIVDATFRPQEFLSRVWEQVTGDSYIVDVRRPRSIKRSLRYMLEYLAKGPAGQEKPWPMADVIRYLETLEDKRMIQVFGCLLGTAEHGEPFICPTCGERLWRVVDLRTGHVDFSEVEHLRRLSLKLGP